MRTDDLGAIAGSTDWDAWGNERASSGVQGRFGWAGESTDATTGHSYLRACDYSPGTGRFTSRDTLVPNASGTNGYNPYWYANDNPATLTDSTGQSAFCAICAPIAAGALASFMFQRVQLAARARYETRHPATAGRWTAAAIGLVAAIFVCLLSPSCHEATGVVTGEKQDPTESFKRHSLGGGLLSAAIAVAAVAIAVLEDCTPIPGTKNIKCKREEPCRFKLPWRDGKIFRENLACLTRINWPDGPDGYEAHHVFPKAFIIQFESIKGFGSVHDPKHGVWAEDALHHDIHGPYNRRWAVYLAAHPTPTLSEVYAQGRSMMQPYGIPTLF